MASYTETVPLTVADILRVVVRISLMPFVSMVGGSNKDLMLTLERLSPVLILLPAAAYGTGYLGGKAARTRIHSEIEENKKKKNRRERKTRTARTGSRAHAPEQLN